MCRGIARIYMALEIHDCVVLSKTSRRGPALLEYAISIDYLGPRIKDPEYIRMYIAETLLNSL